MEGVGRILFTVLSWNCLFDHRKARCTLLESSVVLQPFVGLWLLFQILDPIHTW
jgi:hypothetical protein